MAKAKNKKTASRKKQEKPARCKSGARWLSSSLRYLNNLRESFCRLNTRACAPICAIFRGAGGPKGRLPPDPASELFLDAIAHELKNPVAAMEKHLAQIEKNLSGKKPPSPALMQDYITRIRSNVKHLSGFIEDVADVSDIEQGTFECELRSMSIQAAVEKALAKFEEVGQEHEVTLSNRMDPACGRVRGDPQRIAQVLERLISNALKFTASGGEIWIEAEPYKENEEEFLRVAVCDTGIGMDKEDARKIFEKFRHGRNTGKLMGKDRGSGLGLYIVKAIINEHGGRLSVKIQPGKGTKFLFELKLA